MMSPLATASVSLYQVPLRCEAVPGMGCGVVAKPILAILAREPAVAEAWLNRNGTIVAIRWRESIASNVPGDRIRSILAKQGLAARELAGAARKSTLRDFSSGAGWYRGDAVDRLSEEEAAIIAARLVHRVTAKVPLSDDKIETLLKAFGEVCRHQLINRPVTSAPLRRQRIENEILKLGRKHLDGAVLKALEEAVSLGHQPTTGET